MTMAAAARDPGVQSPFRRFVADFAGSQVAMAGLAVFALVLAAALLAPLLSPQNPYDLNQLDIMDGRQPPMAKSMDGFVFWLGSDDQGRDMLSAKSATKRRNGLCTPGSRVVAPMVIPSPRRGARADRAPNRGCRPRG
ncbi:MAG: hypothetical protein ACKOUS_09960 [Alphaproteobacteria bacterium]